MRTKTVRLDDLTRNVLLRSDISGNRLTLPEQLERADYNRVAKAIEAAGGKWSRKERCHLFPQDVRECMDIKTDTVEIVNQQQTFQAFYTPTEIANRVAELADLMAGYTVLEPSAGTGQLARAAVRYGVFWSSITAIEVSPKLIPDLEINGFKQVVCADFLTCKPGVNLFDRILMNPPFANGVDIQHIKHALNFLADGGRLVAICANGPRQQEQLKPLADQWIDLESGAFESSGTGVNAAILVINK